VEHATVLPFEPRRKQLWALEPYTAVVAVLQRIGVHGHLRGKKKGTRKQIVGVQHPNVVRTVRASTGSLERQRPVMGKIFPRVLEKLSRNTLFRKVASDGFTGIVLRPRVADDPGMEVVRNPVQRIRNHPGFVLDNHGETNRRWHVFFCLYVVIVYIATVVALFFQQLELDKAYKLVLGIGGVFDANLLGVVLNTPSLAINRGVRFGTDGRFLIFEKRESIVLDPKTVGKLFLLFGDANDIDENANEECHLEHVKRKENIHFYSVFFLLASKKKNSTKSNSFSK
jgi:hypothetical protein